MDRPLHAFSVTVLLTLAPLSVATAQAPQARSPYAGQQTRVVKALSDEAVRGFLEGRGMALALPAELNHYPGPRHALDLADSLRLTAEQRAAIREIYSGMNARVVPLGRSLVAVESRLDSAFALGAVTSESLAVLLQESATLTEQLRLAHLGAHLELRPLLSTHQVTAYDRLRGYQGPGDQHHEGH